MAESGKATITYFVAKCVNMDSLKRSAKNNIWACCDRKFPPHPRHLLTEALKTGEVILLFSVNNCHGWHGYARVLNKPGSVSVQDFNASLDPNDTKLVIKDKSDNEEPEWQRFKIEWKQLYLREHGEQCLSSSETEDLLCTDGQPMNKARNFQDVPSDIGELVCQKIDTHYNQLTLKRQKKLEEQRQKLPPPFFQPGVEQDPQVIWEKLVHKVEGMGKVLLACAFGSQRCTIVLYHLSSIWFIYTR